MGLPQNDLPVLQSSIAGGNRIFYVEGEINEKAFVCGKCKRYLITVNQAGALNRSQQVVVAMSFTHLDLILQGKGYSQMAVSQWNSL